MPTLTRLPMLEDAFSEKTEIGIVRKHRTDSGLISYDARRDTDWPQVAREIIAVEKPKFIVMMIGNTARQTIRARIPAPPPSGPPKANVQPMQPAPSAAPPSPPVRPDPEQQPPETVTNDGVYFTKFGARKVALYVEREIERSLSSQRAPVALPAPAEPEHRGTKGKPGGSVRPVAG